MIVLGVDAAWTPGQPSGVALVTKTDRWRLKNVAPSYAAFAETAACGWTMGHRPDVSELLRSAAALAGRRPAIVAIDMPMSLHPITRRRVADDAVSRAYGARHCSTHTPSSERPGPLSDKLRTDFAAEGFPLRTRPAAAGLIEVYPHPALVELTGAPRRLPYKVGRARAYWPELSPLRRREALICQWETIVGSLEAEIEGVVEALPLPLATVRLSALKAYEDQLDAVVCAWVGVCMLEGRAVAYGDADAAIWIPAAREAAGT